MMPCHATWGCIRPCQSCHFMPSEWHVMSCMSCQMRVHQALPVMPRHAMKMACHVMSAMPHGGASGPADHAIRMPCHVMYVTPHGDASGPAGHAPSRHQNVMSSHGCHVRLSSCHVMPVPPCHDTSFIMPSQFTSSECQVTDVIIVMSCHVMDTPSHMFSAVQQRQPIVGRC
jgi:hypothetical protein